MRRPHVVREEAKRVLALPLGRPQRGDVGKAGDPAQRPSLGVGEEGQVFDGLPAVGEAVGPEVHGGHEPEGEGDLAGGVGGNEINESARPAFLAGLAKLV